MARKAGKAQTHQTAKKVKKTLSFDVETARRLGSYAAHVGQTESAIVVELVKLSLKDYRSFVVGIEAAQEESRPVRLAGEGQREAG
jgi:predicted DNA-binding protein